MAGFYSGQDGQLFINDNVAVKIRSWSFTANQSVLETVTLEDRDRSIIPGIRSITGSASVYYYQSTTGGGAGQLTTLIQNMIKQGDFIGDPTAAESNKMKFKLRIKDGSTAGRFIEFRAIPTSFAMTSAVGEVTAADVSFEVDGAPSSIAL